MDAQQLLKRFEIKGLFGDYDVSIPFFSDATIVIGENGSGKSTIMNLLYNFLSGNLGQLLSVEFDSLTVAFPDGDPVVLKKEDLAPLRRTFVRDWAHRRKTSGDKILMWDTVLQKLADQPAEYRLEGSQECLYADSQKLHYPISKRNSISRALRTKLGVDILYLPTYRRIEEDLNALTNGTLEYPGDGAGLIRFGMADVEKRFDDVTKAIKDSAVESFAKVTGEMLRQLVDGLKVTKEMKQAIAHPDRLAIVLDRVGRNLGQTYKDSIGDLIGSEQIYSDHDPLIYFLANLMNIYDQERARDNSIKQFCRVCNGYLVGKQVVYNESVVEISIVDERTGHPIRLSKLSSGEKQIVSLFSRIFLSEDQGFVILFDEPELSLSIDWQRHLLTDILDSGKSKFLLVATHSPFIFDNRLDQNAVSLEQCIKVAK